MIQKNIQKCCRNFIIFKFECVMCTINANKNTCNLCLQAFFFNFFFADLCVIMLSIIWKNKKWSKHPYNLKNFISVHTDIWLIGFKNVFIWIIYFLYINIYTAIRYSTELDYVYRIRLITWVFFKRKYFHVKIKNFRFFFHHCVTDEINFNNQKKFFVYLFFLLSY